MKKRGRNKDSKFKKEIIAKINDEEKSKVKEHVEKVSNPQSKSEEKE